MKYITGPVPSRKLGYSLLIDILPKNICTYDCVYCEYGKTKKKTSNIIDFNNTEEIIKEFIQYKNNFKLKIDNILFAGKGEPFISENIFEIANRIKQISNMPVSIKTNCVFLHKDKIIDKMKIFDTVILEIDTVNEKTYHKLNNPHKDIDFGKTLDGIRKFIKEFKNKILIEVFFVKDINVSSKELLELRRFFQQLNIFQIQINTIMRLPAYEKNEPIDEEDKIRIKSLLGDIAETELIFNDSKNYKHSIISVEELLRKRPCTFETISMELNISVDNLKLIIQDLEKRDKLKIEYLNNEYFYGIKNE